ncbi:MAG: hypothetical protein ACR2N2_02565 [Acidimicrobiia bacterium]
MSRFTLLAFGLLLALTLVACGGSGDESSDDTSAPTSSAAASDQSSDPSDDTSSVDGQDTDTVPTDVSGVFDTAGGTAAVTIGDQSWEFVLPEDHPIANCDADFFGGFVAILTNEGAVITSPSDVMALALPGGDFDDTPSLEVKLQIDSEDEWIADETIYEQNADLPAGLGVTDFTIDGTTASGTATFFEQESYYQFNAGNGDLRVADGTFTVTCVAE